MKDNLAMSICASKDFSAAAETRTLRRAHFAGNGTQSACKSRRRLSAQRAGNADCFAERAACLRADYCSTSHLPAPAFAETDNGRAEAVSSESYDTVKGLSEVVVKVQLPDSLNILPL